MEGCVWYADDDYIFVEYNNRVARVDVRGSSPLLKWFAVRQLAAQVDRVRAALARAEYGRLH